MTRLPLIWSDTKYSYNPTTDIVLSWYPKYMKIRTDNVSNYKSLINAITTEMDDLYQRLGLQIDSTYLRTAPYTLMDVVYFTPYTENTIYKTNIDNSQIILSQSQYNNFYDWWYKTIPTAYTTYHDTILQNDPYLIHDAPAAQEYKIQQFFTDPVPLFITLSCSGTIMPKNINNISIPFKIIIYGHDEIDNTIIEEIDFVYKSTIQSDYMWKYIDKIQCDFYDDPSRYIVTVSIIPPATLSYDWNTTYIDMDTNNPMVTFWEIDTTTTSILHHKTFNGSTLDDIYINDESTYTIDQYMMLAPAILPDFNFADIKSICVDAKYLYIITSDKLLCIYDKHKHMSDLTKKALSLRTMDADLQFIVNNDNATYFSAQIHDVSLRQFMNIKYYRFIMEKGEQKYLYNPEAEDDANRWIPYEDKWFQYKQPPNTPLDLPTVYYSSDLPIDMDILLYIELMTTNNEIIREATVINSHVKLPIAVYTLPAEWDPISVFKTQHNLLAIYHDNTITYLLPQNDTYITDGELAFFAHKYQNITANDTPITLASNNILTPIDSHGILHGYPRQDGQKLYNYLPILKRIAKAEHSATRNGLIYSITYGLNLHIEECAILSDLNTPFEITISWPNIKIRKNDTIIEKYLFEFPTIQALINWLTSEPLNLTIAKISNNLEYLNLSPRHLLDTSNTKYYKPTYYGDTYYIQPKLALREYIIPSSVSIQNIDSSQYTATQTTIVSDVLLNSYNLVSFTTYTDLRLLASPVIVSSIHDIKHLVSDTIDNIHFNIIISNAEHKFPNKWPK